MIANERSERASSGEEPRLCPQCNQEKEKVHFISVRKDAKFLTVQCDDCRYRYGGWQRLTLKQKLSRKRPRRETGTGYLVSFNLRSQNVKTGPIPVSMTDMRSCPDACSFKSAGCYAEMNRGTTWPVFCKQVAAGPNNRLDMVALAQLVRANVKAKARGFTFTHKPLLDADERRAIALANAQGFTINLSADNLAHADELADLRIGPVVVVLPSAEAADSGPLFKRPKAPRLKTSAGRHITICPAQTVEGMTCEKCRLCAVATRKTIVGFQAHGVARRMVSQIVQLRRKSA